jgi:ribosomal-protein-alanine N-acetyltransferase
MITHKGSQTIQTQRLILRKITSDDLEMIYDWMRDPELTKYEDWIPHGSVDYTRGFISWLTGDYKTEHIYCWGLQLGERIIGFAMVVDVNEWSGSIAYYIKRDLWSNGYATEAVDAIMNFMFFDVGLDRINAKHSIKNIASGKVLRKAGMRYRGHVKEFEYYTSKSEWHDCDFYTITKEQYSRKKLA